MPSDAPVIVALGGNLGPVLRHFNTALTALTVAGWRPLALSRAYRTRALVRSGAPPGPAFWNAAVCLDGRGSAHDLLRCCQRLELQAGRQPGPRWAARPLDLDIILWGDSQQHDHDLTLPHPHMHERLFVLKPIMDIAPEAAVPGRARRIRDLYSCFPDPDDGILEVRDRWRCTPRAPRPQPQQIPRDGLFCALLKKSS